MRYLITLRGIRTYKPKERNSERKNSTPEHNKLLGAMAATKARKDVGKAFCRGQESARRQNQCQPILGEQKNKIKGKNSAAVLNWGGIGVKGLGKQGRLSRSENVPKKMPTSLNGYFSRGQ